LSAEGWHPVGQKEIVRAHELTAMGFHDMDALHLACAEYAKAEIFLTTDDRLRRAAKRAGGGLNVSVDNPLPWLTETLHGRDIPFDDPE
jgi:hypothetical protein